GLGGELRQVHRTERRLAEAARLGFTRAVVPRSAPDPPDGMRVARSASIVDALRVTRVVPAAPPPVDRRGNGERRREPEAIAHGNR
ncbi:MAG: DNA repair protein RadA, partial [Candidatus Limnocylindrales bacterium]